MAEEIALENCHISNFEGLVTLTLDRVILHTFVYHSSASTYIPNFIEIKETFCGQTDAASTYTRTDGHLRPTLYMFGQRHMSQGKIWGANDKVISVNVAVKQPKYLLMHRSSLTLYVVQTPKITVHNPDTLSQLNRINSTGIFSCYIIWHNQSTDLSMLEFVCYTNFVIIIIIIIMVTVQLNKHAF